tara:strand:- start:969 stop:1277 length:309 start_codon:yes stop_codon:yes gene_type:complete
MTDEIAKYYKRSGIVMYHLAAELCQHPIDDRINTDSYTVIENMHIDDYIDNMVQSEPKQQTDLWLDNQGRLDYIKAEKSLKENYNTSYSPKFRCVIIKEYSH